MRKEALLKEAAYYQREEKDRVLCLLCPHHCLIGPGKRGLCRTRLNKRGTLYAENYGKVAALHLDPVEKKPLKNFRPGSVILSVGSYGCNMFCPYCQNHDLVYADQKELRQLSLPAEELVQEALRSQKDGNIGLAFTYNEPTVWYETMLEAARLAKKEGLEVVVVTNGLIEADPWDELLAYVDAVNIDLKAFDPKIYKKRLGGFLPTVCQSISMASQRVHVEVTTLMAPAMVGAETVGDIAQYLAGLDPTISLHISRFFPHFKMSNFPPTPLETIKEASRLAKKHLEHVYLGNV